MAISFNPRSRRRILFYLFVLAIITAIVVVPFQMRLRAAKGPTQPTTSHDPGLPNYDIRADKTAVDKLAVFRDKMVKTATDTAIARTTMVRGEQSLRRRVPTLKVEYNTDLGIPEVIAPDVKQGRAFLTPAAKGTRTDILKNFLTQNADMIGARTTDVADLKVVADYTNPDGNLSYVELDQELGGIPVFRGEVKAAFTKRGEMMRVINNFAPGLDQTMLSTDFGDPADAVKAAAGYLNIDTNRVPARSDLAVADTGEAPARIATALRPPRVIAPKPIIVKPEKLTSDLKAVFGKGDSAWTAEKIYFPTEPGVAVAAWRVLIWQPVNAYYVIVDAQTGTMLWRKNITEDQTQSATYSVYANPNAMMNVAHNPFPFSPGPLSPNGVQGAGIGRTSVTLIGNEAPYTFNNLGWIPDGGTITDGNAVQAGLDRDGVDGVDTNSEAVSPTRNFTFAYNPFDPNTGLGDNPVPASQTYPGSIVQQGGITQLFYICNWYHDITYTLGFNEQAKNFQNDNFGRGGVAGDRVRGEGQDSSGTNNANFSTPADGGRGRMQMYIFTNGAAEPDIDGNVDAEVVVHEHTHGLSNRLHGNGSGLSTNMSRGMGEGWSDFYALSLLSQPSDPVNGIYTIGAYDTYHFQGTAFVNNSFYGIRRFPYAVKSFTGGASNLPFDPMTFADVDQTTLNVSDGAFPRGPVGSSTADEVHNMGEIWCIALWEVRARLVTRLGWTVGNRRALQLVTDGMKLAPLAPTFLSERDAIIAAAQANPDPVAGAADVADIWAGFATRGVGYSASIQNVGNGAADTRVTEAFDLPNLFQNPDLTISDASGNNNGFAEPGEKLTLSIPLTNSTGTTATGVTLQVVGGGTANYGTMAGISTATQQVTYYVPSGATCGSVITLTLNVNSSLGPVSFTRTFGVGQPITTFTENFDGLAPPGIVAGWTVTSSYAPMTFASSGSSFDSTPNSMFAADLPAITGGPTTDGGSTELTSPSIAITVPAAIVSFRHKYNSEPGWDGGVLEISIAGGAFQDFVVAGGAFLQNGYNASMGVSSPNPLGGRAGWTGDSGGYITTVARMPAAASGQSVQLRWRFGADNNSAPAGGGWNVDSIQVAGNFGCSAVPGVSVSGHVTTASLSGLRNAVVILTDAQNVSRTATTDAFGFYQFNNVLTGQTYTVSVVTKHYRFLPQQVSVAAALTGIDFVGDE